ncbi:hypothetical protein [Candidatus Pyrohabitans sp.]
MRGRVFLRSLAIFGGAFLAARGILLLPDEKSVWLLLPGLLFLSAGLSYSVTEENALAQIFAGYGAAALLAVLLLGALGL